MHLKICFAHSRKSCLLHAETKSNTSNELSRNRGNTTALGEIKVCSNPSKPTGDFNIVKDEKSKIKATVK